MSDNIRILEDHSGIVVTENHNKMHSDYERERKLLSQPFHENVKNVIRNKKVCHYD